MQFGLVVWRRPCELLPKRSGGIEIFYRAPLESGRTDMLMGLFNIGIVAFRIAILVAGGAAPLERKAVIGIQFRLVFSVAQRFVGTAMAGFGFLPESMTSYR